MSDPPALDGRDAADLRTRLESLAPYYPTDWDPESADAGGALVALFAEMAGGLTARVDRAPHKHRVAFLDALGFDRRPPQSASVPVTFEIDPDAPGNVPVPGGTVLEAAGESDERRFRIDESDAVEATPSRLTDLLAVDPDGDRLLDHGAVIAHEGSHDGRQTTPFEGPDVGRNELYVGHPRRLAVPGGGTVTLRIDGSVDPTDLVWEYFGEPAEGEAPTEDERPANEGEPANEEEPANDDEPAWRRVEDVIDGSGAQVSLVLGGSVVETVVDGIENAWIRGRLRKEGRGAERFDVSVESLSIVRRSHAAAVDAAYANDVPQPIDGGEVAPFGEVPQRRDALHLASAGAFGKAGATVDVTFHDVTADRPSDLDSEPRLSWEYFDGSAWRRLDVRTSSHTYDGHDVFHRNLRQSTDRTVRFDVPEDVATTRVAGHEGVWIRVRLVAGEYVDVRYVHSDGESERRTDGVAPQFDGVSVTYAYGDDDQPTHLIARNTREYGENLVDAQGPIRLFEPLPDAFQTLYFGFDRPLEGGPIRLYADLADREFPAGFDPRVRWEYCADPDADDWGRLSARDGTDGFTRSGTVSLSFPEPTEPVDRFGVRRHWVRARLRGDAFEPEIDRSAESESGVDRPDFRSDSATRTDVSSLSLRSGSDGIPPIVPPTRIDPGEPSSPDSGRAVGVYTPCESVLETAPGGVVVDRSPPRMEGIHVNTTVASNVRVVDDEILGSSDESPNRTVTVGDAPLIDVEVWVDESATLSAHERELLAADRSVDVDVDARSDGTVRATWVRWREVTDLAAADGDDRAYAVDRIDGEIRFGDGSHGRIPPRGRDNLRASYRVGGGSGGNVARGTVKDLASDVVHVDGVTNPVGGAGGADAESTDAVLDRAPRKLRDRDRATTAADYERVAADAARELATVRCLRGLNPDGEHEPGWVTLLVVPEEGRGSPRPSTELLGAVERAVGERAPLHLVANDRIVVRGPTYVPVGTEATVVAEADVRLGDLEGRIEERLTALLHPLSGNDGDGWSFGELPTVTDVIGVIETEPGVDHVPSLRIHYDGARGRETMTKGETPPAVSPDVLVRSGAHELVVGPRTRNRSEGA